MQKHTIKSIAASYSNEINTLKKINNKFLKLFGTKGSININYGLNRENCLDITYVEASAELPTKEHLPYCKAIHLCELREKLDALYQLFKKVSVEEKSTPQKIIDLIESNEEKDQRLNERDYGDLVGLNKAETAEKFGKEQVHIWRRSYDTPPPNGESLKDVVDRVSPYFTKTIQPFILDKKNVLIAAHGNSLRAIMIKVGMYKPEEISSIELPTGSPLCLDYANGQLQRHYYLD